MPIDVHCRLCGARFQVEDIMAGADGHCPECHSVLTVPQANSLSDPWGDDRPAPRRRHADERDDDHDHDHDALMPRRSRRSRPRDVDSDREDDPGPRRFDPQVRAERWRKVRGGFRNLMIAGALLLISQSINIVLVLMEGLPQFEEEKKLENKDIVVNIATMLFLLLSTLFWTLGRRGLAYTPYVPARGWAMTAAVSALLTLMGVFCSTIAILAGFIIAQNDLQAGFGLVGLGVIGIGLTLLPFLVAEFAGVVSQIKMSAALSSAGFRRWSWLQLMTYVLCCATLFFGCCATGFYVAAEQEKKLHQMQIQQAQKDNEEFQKKLKADNPGGPGNGADVAVKDAVPKQPAPVGRPKRGPGMRNQPGQPPPPQFKPNEHPNLMRGWAIASMVISFSVYLIVVIASVSGLAATRNEIERLSFDPDRDEHDPKR